MNKVGNISGSIDSNRLDALYSLISNDSIELTWSEIEDYKLLNLPYHSSIALGRSLDNLSIYSLDKFSDILRNVDTGIYKISEVGVSIFTPIHKDETYPSTTFSVIYHKPVCLWIEGVIHEVEPFVVYNFRSDIYNHAFWVDHHFLEYPPALILIFE